MNSLRYRAAFRLLLFLFSGQYHSQTSQHLEGYTLGNNFILKVCSYSKPQNCLDAQFACLLELHYHFIQRRFPIKDCWCHNDVPKEAKALQVSLGLQSFKLLQRTFTVDEIHTHSTGNLCRMTWYKTKAFRLSADDLCNITFKVLCPLLWQPSEQLTSPNGMIS